MTKVLIIDDDGFEMEPHVHALERAGFAVIFCNNVTDALRQIEDVSIPFDLMVVDIMMPTDDLLSDENTAHGSLTGLCLIRAARLVRPDLHILVLTVREDMEVTRALASAQIQGYLHKPIMPQDFLEATLTVLRRERR